MARGLIALAVLLLATPVFAQTTVRIVVQIEPPGSGFVNGAGIYVVGTEVRLEAEPVIGFRFVAWEEEGKVIWTSSVLEFVAERDREIVARFEAVPPPPEFSGRWVMDFRALPTPAIKSGRLELTAKQKLEASQITISFIASFSSSSWTLFYLRTNASLAGLSLGGGLTFDPTGPAYKSAYIGVSGSREKLRWNLRVSHSPLGGIPPGPYLLYSLNLYYSPLSLTLRAEDGVTGTRFLDLFARISELPLIACPAQASLFFTKEGFQYFDIQLQDIELCCDIAFDARVKFTLNAKEISLAPRWSALKGCLSTYGDVDWDEENSALKGFTIYGWKINCCLVCNACPKGRVRGPYLEWVTAFDPARVPGGFRGEEFEYWKFGTCGPACCGGYWSLEGTAYFSHTAGLFGLSRFVVSGTLPLGTGILINWSMHLDLTADVVLDIGWDWAF